MVLHSCLLVIQTLVVIAAICPYSASPNVYSIVWTCIPAVDMLVQLCICYICWTMGSSMHLRNFDCYLIQNSQGDYIVKYELKDHIKQVVGEAYHAETETQTVSDD